VPEPGTKRRNGKRAAFQDRPSIGPDRDEIMALPDGHTQIIDVPPLPGLNKRQLAERRGWQPSRVTRLFDGRYASRADKIEAALASLGRRLMIDSEAS
jgi:hypothetical protein